MRNMKTSQTRPSSEQTLYVPEELKTCSHVCVRQDQVTGALERPYIGPFRVVKRNQHTYTIDMTSGEQDISIESLKPAFVDRVFTPQKAYQHRKVGRPRKVTSGGE